MSHFAIQVRDLAKEYTLGERQGRNYKSVRDVVSGMFTPGNGRRTPKETFWALKDVNFDVQHGEVLGVIGRNGAGKSTLLKVLTRITEPTRGEVRLRGRVGSLLEVGTGFHPELTGRENIYLNGAILGMHRRETAAKFDEIVDFAEVEQFIDTPVKRYSSGMYLRLAFAVAAHLEPEILLVDEVLAVGDAAFQKKCLGKMGDVAKAGRTVLFVSHNMAAMSSLCENGLMLASGQVVKYGGIQEVIKHYLENNETHKSLFADLTHTRRKGSQKAHIRSIHLLSGEGENRFPHTGEDIEFKLEVESTQAIYDAILCITIYDLLGNRLIDAATDMLGWTISMKANEIKTWVVHLKNVLLRTGQYRVEFFLGLQYVEAFDIVEDALIFEMLPAHENSMGTVDYPSIYRCKFDIQPA
jgi:lipopolysaccharide transport system ATP-binding protein